MIVLITKGKLETEHVKEWSINWFSRDQVSNDNQ